MILELDAVGSVAVVGVPDEKWGEVPRAYVQLRPGHILNEEQVKAHLAGRLARYKIPKTVVTVADMPRTSTGKIRKRDLRRSWGSESSVGPTRFLHPQPFLRSNHRSGGMTTVMALTGQRPGAFKACCWISSTAPFSSTAPLPLITASLLA